MFRKKCLALFLTGTIIFSNVASLQAIDMATVIINDEILEYPPEAPPQIIEGRLMLPLRAFCTAFNTDEPKWDEAQKQITITSDDSYVVFVIGNPTMQYGKFIIDGNGLKTVDQSSADVVTFETAPVIINGYTMIPIRAAEYAFDAKIDWNEDTKTANVTTNNEQAPAKTPPAKTPPPNVSNDMGPQNPAFADTLYFKEVSAGYVEDLHKSESKFAVVVYNGQDPESIKIIPEIKQAAADAQFKIYGFDATSERFGGNDKLTWVWDLIDKSSLPALILSYGGEGDEVITDFSDMNVIEEKLESFSKENASIEQAAEPVETAVTTAPTATATATPTPVKLEYSWNKVSMKESQKMYEDGKKFAYVVYDSTKDTSYADAVSIMQDLGSAYSVPVYYTDLQGEETVASFWSIKLGVDEVPNPTIMFIFGENQIDHFTDIDYEDKETLEYEMNSLKKALE